MDYRRYFPLQILKRSNMGSCKYCGHDAGFFNSTHSNCESAYRSTFFQMVSLAASVVERGNGFVQLEQQLHTMAANIHPVQINIRSILIAGWEDAVNKTYKDNIIDATAEVHIMGYAQHFGLTQNDLNANGAFTNRYPF